VGKSRIFMEDAKFRTHSRGAMNYSRRIYMTMHAPVARFATAITDTLAGAGNRADAGTVGSMFKQ